MHTRALVCSNTCVLYISIHCCIKFVSICKYINGGKGIYLIHTVKHEPCVNQFEPVRK